MLPPPPPYIPSIGFAHSMRGPLITTTASRPRRPMRPASRRSRAATDHRCHLASSGTIIAVSRDLLHNLCLHLRLHLWSITSGMGTGVTSLSGTVRNTNTWSSSCTSSPSVYASDVAWPRLLPFSLCGREHFAQRNETTLRLLQL